MRTAESTAVELEPLEEESRLPLHEPDNSTDPSPESTVRAGAPDSVALDEVDPDDEIDPPEPDNFVETAEDKKLMEMAADPIVPHKGSSSALRMMFRHINSIPKLEADQERLMRQELIIRREIVEKLSSQKVSKNPIKREEHAKAISNAEARVNELEAEFVKYQLRLVAAMAQKYGRGRGNLADLIQEGNEVVVEKVKQFDPKRGYRFSTYISWWILQRVYKASMGKSDIIRLPANVIKIRNLKARVIKEMTGEHGKEPDYEPDLAEVAEKVGTTLARIQQVDKVSRVTKSLNTPVYDGEGPELIDITPDEHSPKADHQANINNEKEYLGRLFEKLDERERYVMTQRYGMNLDLDGSRKEMDDGKTLEAIGKTMNVTREWIRKIEEKALAKLKRAAMAHPR